MKGSFNILAISLLIISCTADNPDKYLPEGSEAGRINLEPCVFKTDSFSYVADCGTLAVLENQQAEGSRLIGLPVKRIHARNSDPAEPIFYLAGGPGQSNMKFNPPDELLADHDIIMIGYRGVDGSVVLDCPEVKRAIKGTGKDLLAEQSMSELNSAFKQCAARLMQEGTDLNAYTMIDVIRDMEAAREALGYERINLLSESYGTRIAQIYAYQHPENIFRSVMIGVNPPGHFVWEPDTIDRQIEYYARLCSMDTVCSDCTPDLVETMRNVIQNMPRRWLFLPVDKGKVKLITFALLYHRKTAAMVFDTYLAAEKGDQSGLALMTLAYNFMFPSMITWGDLASKATSADFDKNRNYSTEMDPPGSILGSPFSKLLWSLTSWPTASIPDEFRKPQSTDVETLLLGGSVDFSTPAGYTTSELLPYMTNGRQVILKEMGHTGDIWKLQRPATIHLITGFYDTGKADDSKFTYAPMDFDVKPGFPELAKIGLAVFVLIISGLILLTRFIIRRIVSRRAR